MIKLHVYGGGWGWVSMLSVLIKMISLRKAPKLTGEQGFERGGGFIGYWEVRVTAILSIIPLVRFGPRCVRRRDWYCLGVCCPCS